MNNREIGYSQNFLKNQDLAKSLINKPDVHIYQNDTVVEIGAGKGILTRVLAEKIGTDGKLLALEIDHQLFQNLREEFSGTRQITLFNKDFRNFLLPNSQYKIFSNIPFNITSQIVNRILNYNIAPSYAYLFIQRDAALMYGGKRISESTNESLKSLLAYPFYNFRNVHNFLNTDFTPTPNIAIVLIEISKREKPLVDLKYKELYENFISAISEVRVGENVWKKIFTENQLQRVVKECGLINNKGISFQNADSILKAFNSFQKYVSVDKQSLINRAKKRLTEKQDSIKKIHRTRIDKEWRDK